MRLTCLGVLAMVLSACGGPSAYRVDGGRVLAPETRVVGEILSFSFPLTGHKGQVGDCSKMITVQHYKSGHVAVVNIDHKSKHTAYATEVDHDLRLEHRLREAMDECKIAPTEFGRFARYLPTSTGSAATVVPLVPGMRVKLERGGGTKDTSAHLGVDSVTLLVLREGTEGVVFGASSRIRNVSPSQATTADECERVGEPSVNSGLYDATIPADLNVPSGSGALSFWRLYIPIALAPPLTTPDNTVGTVRQFVFAGASSAAALDKVFTSKLRDECQSGLRCVMFRGHTEVIPEIPVSIQGRPMYVAVGTTLGDVITRVLDLTRVSDDEVTVQFRSRLKMYRWHGTRLAPVAILFDQSWLALPIRHGDVVRW
jgi:hypothetical protein